MPERTLQIRPSELWLAQALPSWLLRAYQFGRGDADGPQDVKPTTWRITELLLALLKQHDKFARLASGQVVDSLDRSR